MNELTFNKGEISANELEDPLISLGIADSKEDVKKIVDSIDDNGEIEFKEFLDIIRGKTKLGEGIKSNALIDFFKDMINGKLGEGTISKALPF